jgi:hypothetical protein
MIAPHPSGVGLLLTGCVAGGQAEATGMVCEDDMITHINGVSIVQLAMPDILDLIKSSTAPKFTVQQPEPELCTVIFFFVVTMLCMYLTVFCCS